MAQNKVADENHTLRIWLLGDFRVSIGAHAIPESAWRLRKARSLVKLLALGPKHQLHREQVLELLWPDLEAEAAANNLHNALHAIRRILEPQAPPRQPSTFLRLQEGILTLCPSTPLWVDIEAFMAASATARRTQNPADYLVALALYTGDLLPEDRYEDWATRRREELHQLHLALLSELAQLYRDRHEYAQALATLEQLIAAEPLLEKAHIDLMRLYALTGQRYQALRQYQQLRDILQRELNVAPAAAARQLYQDIRAGRLSHGQAQPAALTMDGDTKDARLNIPPVVGPLISTGSTEATSATNLHTPPTSFVGRQREIEQVRHLLASSRLLTLTGAGGCGKTRLALEVARAVLATYPGGVWLVELATLADPTLVAQAVNNVLGLHEEAHCTPQETLVNFLRSRRLLLLLDNCEHLRAACAKLVDTLLRECPGVHILATSRQPLHLIVETAWRVPSLSVPDSEHLPPFEHLLEYDAIHLFLQRAVASRPGFLLTTANAPAVLRICHRLDGIPLALELAAARIKVLAAEQIADRLDDALGLLTSGARTAPLRQQTLQATLDWSYTLLSEREQALLRRLAVFAGGAALQAIEAVCSSEDVAPAQVLDLLGELADKSLVIVEEREGQARYRLLETVRQFGIKKLTAAGELAAVRRRHAAWYLALTETETSGEERKRWLEQLEAEHDNLRAALQWALESNEVEEGMRLAGALWLFWDVHGHLSEGRRWLEALLASKAPVATSVRAKALRCAGLLALNQGDYERAGALLEESLAHYRQVNDKASTAWVLNNLGNLALDRGDLERATSLYEQSLALYRELGDKDGVGRALNNLAIVAAYREDYDEALVLFEAGLAVQRDLGHKDGIAQVLTNLGELAVRKGDYTKAAEYYSEGLALHWEMGYKNGVAYCLEGMAAVAAGQDKPAFAARLGGAAQKLRETIGTALSPGDLADFENRLSTARAQLEAASFVRAWEAGRTLPLAEIIKEALEQAQGAWVASTEFARPANDKSPDLLSQREREVVTLLAAGYTNREIATALNISQRTVDTHVSKILTKLNFNSRAQIVTWAQEQQAITAKPAT